jgi:hypothetical protein
MAEEKEEKVNAFYSMGKGASYTDRTSGLNSLADAMNLQMENYSEQMALAAAQRRAARQDKRAAKKDAEAYGEEIGTPNQEKIDANTEANRKRTEEPTNPPPPPPPSAAPMKSPMKNLYSAARGSTYSGDIKKTSKELSGIVAFSNKVKLDMKKALNDKISAELKNFVPEAIDIQGFDNFKNGKNACANFGMNLKQQLAQKKNEALKLNPYSQEYKLVIKDINNLVESSKNLTLEKTKLSNMKKEWGETSVGDLYSGGSSKMNMNYLDQVHSGVAGMTLDPFGKAQFMVAVVDENGDFVTEMVDGQPKQVEQLMTIDQMMNNVFEKVDASEDYRTLQSEIRDNVRNGVDFDREGVAGYWSKKIAPKWETGTQDEEILSWIYDNPEGGTQSYYDYFAEKYEIREGNESGMFTTEQLDEVFNYDTSDWDEVYGDTGKKLRELIYNDLVAYNTNIVENYYSKQTRTEDKHTKENNFNVGEGFDPFSKYEVVTN